MTEFSLYRRFTKQGTLTDPDEVPDPRFALPSTVNWMHALALLVRDRGVDFASAKAFYVGVGKRRFSPQEENTVFEQLLFALHQLSALEALRTLPHKADVVRVGIVAWYYGIYAAASAMVTAQDGSFQEDHTGTANAWDRQFGATGKSMEPFALRVSSLIQAEYKAELKAMVSGSFPLTSKPTAPDEAFRACCAYLSGSADWWKWKAEQSVKASREFKALGVTDFRTRQARELRDSRLSGKAVGFLHQAFRYRGKANYREALFLGYGHQVEAMLEDYLDDLTEVLRAFVAMAGAFASMRLGRDLWNAFLADVESHRSFQLNSVKLWN